MNWGDPGRELLLMGRNSLRLQVMGGEKALPALAAQQRLLRGPLQDMDLTTSSAFFSQFHFWWNSRQKRAGRKGQGTASASPTHVPAPGARVSLWQPPLPALPSEQSSKNPPKTAAEPDLLQPAKFLELSGR